MSVNHENIIASLAILHVNWDHDQSKDYLQPFAEMLAEVIYQNDESVLTVGALQKQYRELFGLKLPAGVIKSLLRRLEKLKYVQSRDGHFRPELDRLSARNFHTTRHEVLSGYDSLIQKLIDFCASEFEIELFQSEAEQYLESFLAEHQSDLLYAMISGTQPIVPLYSSRNPSQKYMTGCFISAIARDQTKEFDYLEKVLKGMMLANVLYLPDNKRIKKKWSTAIYFDTPFLVEVLGYQGKTKQDLRNELLSGLRGTGAKLRCFRHNLQEVINILYVCLNIIERGNVSEAYGPMATTIDYLVEERFTPPELHLALTQTEGQLGELGIEVYDKPDYVRQYGVDEAKLEEYLLDGYSSNGNSDKEGQRKNDIDSVAAIYRLRRGMSFRKIEDCKAVFVSNNVALLKASHRLFAERPGEITHCITDFTLSNLLWLLHPDILPEMPRKLIIADAYAATQPDARLWNKYIRRIETLKNRKAIQAEDYYAYRFTQEARASLMEITRGAGDTFTDGTVEDVLKSVKLKFQQETIENASRQQAELQRQADQRTQALSEKLEMKERERKELLDKELRSSHNRKVRSRKIARRVFTLVRFTLSMVNVGVWFLSSPTHIFAIRIDEQSHSIQVIAGIAWLIVTLFLFVELRDGMSLRRRLDRAERGFATWVETKLVNLTE